ncbi:unnamed protein product [Macrosiphum euphorbiae]|uniref:Uncharacterized protein n=1 Tax=Macrosiphum euphorbiae TaxID=13131 RepID=A0AAV0W6H0_9HEMI|nr:unnamed protein product [Macrosiphum euphorbiae]
MSIFLGFCPNSSMTSSGVKFLLRYTDNMVNPFNLFTVQTGAQTVRTNITVSFRRRRTQFSAAVLFLPYLVFTVYSGAQTVRAVPIQNIDTTNRAAVLQCQFIILIPPIESPC